eukprot:m.20352 g.20352  ORF g.20352 m.20352 type:complete len:871 (+) comp12460_c0_seq1:798-3410(+)
MTAPSRLQLYAVIQPKNENTPTGQTEGSNQKQASDQQTSLSSDDELAQGWTDVFMNSKLWQPAVEQTPQSLATFLSTLYTMTSFLSEDEEVGPKMTQVLSRFTEFPPAGYALHSLMKRYPISDSLKTVLAESFLSLTAKLVPSDSSNKVEENALFSEMRRVWAHLLSVAAKSSSCDSFEQVVDVEEICKAPMRFVVNGHPSAAFAEPVALNMISNEAMVPGLNEKASKDILVRDVLLGHQLQGCLSSPVFFVCTPGKPDAEHSAADSLDLKVWEALKVTAHQHRALKMIPSLSLRSSHPPVLTYSRQGTVCVYTQRVKAVGEDCELLDPVQGMLLQVDPNDLALHTKDFLNKDRPITTLANDDPSAGMDSRETKEATMVLLDTSTSMSWVWDEGLPLWRQDAKFALGEVVEVTESGWGVWMEGDVMEALPEGAYKVKYRSGSAEKIKVFPANRVRPNECNTRLAVAKRLMDAFSNRSKAYDLPHAVGLIMFSSSVNRAGEPTRLFNVFEEHVENATSNGSTALFDALAAARQSLVAFHRRNPSARLRILCLTDGEDTASSMSAHTVCGQLQDSNIVVDSVVIGGTNNRPLKAISTATGGFCFKPSAAADLLKIFELETVLRVGARSNRICQQKPRVQNSSTLLQYANVSAYPYHTPENANEAPKVENVKLATPAAVIKKLQSNTFDTSNSSKNTSSSSSKSSNASTKGITVGGGKRILRELVQYQASPHPSVSIWPDEDDVMHWILLLKGDDSTPYAGGTFMIDYKFGPQYPFRAPIVRFITPVYHCNISSSGKICHSILDRNWNAATTVRNVIDCIYGLLLTPEPDDPLDSTLAEEYYQDPTSYDRNAREHTKKHASKTEEQLKAELEK